MNTLPIVRWRKRDWYLDGRLGQLRAVDNPHDVQPLARYCRTLKRPKILRYWANPGGDAGLANGSFIREVVWPAEDGEPHVTLAQYMNGDFMWRVDSIPEGFTQVTVEHATALLPDCCK